MLRLFQCQWSRKEASPPSIELDRRTVKEKTWLKSKSYDKLFCKYFTSVISYCTEHFSQRIDSSIVKHYTRMHHSTSILWPPNFPGEQTQNHRPADYYNSWPEEVGCVSSVTWQWNVWHKMFTLGS